VSGAAPELELLKCPTCHGRFVPATGPCPRCGAAALETYRVAAVGTVLAATALEAPPPGWPRPHLLALVEVEDAVRLLAVLEAPVPPAGTPVQIRRDGALYRASAEATDAQERGEGDAPRSGPSRASFEPPR
jgi:uncharacterized OB-fold protein